MKFLNKLLKKGLHGQPISVEEMESFEQTEALRNLKIYISVLLSQKEDGKGASVLCASSYSDEGKSGVAIALAKSVATKNKPCVLIDTDLRKGYTSAHFNADDRPGLCDYLLGQVSLDDVLVQIAPNAFLIPRGSSTPYPYELLGGEKMQQLAQLLKERFSYVIYDSAPVGVVSDALALAPIADGTVVICRQKVSYQGDVKKVIKKLKFFQANVLGVVVSGCDFKLSQHALYAKK